MSEPRELRSRRIFYGAIAGALTLVALPRFLPFQTPWPLLALESLACWALLPAYVFAAIALSRGHRRIAAWLGALALVHLVWSFEWLTQVGDGDRAEPLISVLDANLLAPRPGDALADEILAQHADVLALQEVSFEWLDLLDAHGAREAYPYRIAEPHALDRDYFGVAILSRIPFEDARIEHLPHTDFVPFARADLVVNGHPLRIYSIHTGPPASSEWAGLYVRQMNWLDWTLRRDAASGGIVLAAGDFNASPYSFAHRRLLAAGYTEAHEAVGRGTTTTWPNGIFGVPPMRLDHGYVHGATVRSVRELPAHSSDHSPLVIELGLSR